MLVGKKLMVGIFCHFFVVLHVVLIWRQCRDKHMGNEHLVAFSVGCCQFFWTFAYFQEEMQIGDMCPISSSVFHLSSLSHSLSIHHQLDKHIWDVSLIASFGVRFQVAWSPYYYIWCHPIALNTMSPHHPVIVFHTLLTAIAIIVFQARSHDTTSIVLTMLSTCVITIAFIEFHPISSPSYVVWCQPNEWITSSIRSCMIPLSSILCHTTA